MFGINDWRNECAPEITRENSFPHGIHSSMRKEVYSNSIVCGSPPLVGSATLDLIMERVKRLETALRVTESSLRVALTDKKMMEKKINALEERLSAVERSNCSTRDTSSQNLTDRELSDPIPAVNMLNFLEDPRGDDSLLDHYDKQASYPYSDFYAMSQEMENYADFPDQSMRKTLSYPSYCYDNATSNRKLSSHEVDMLHHGWNETKTSMAYGPNFDATAQHDSFPAHLGFNPYHCLPPPTALSRSVSAPMPEPAKVNPSSLTPNSSGPSDKVIFVERNSSGKTTKVIWKVENAKSKLKTGAGKPLVSPQFEIDSEEGEMKLMLFPYFGDYLGCERNGKELRTRERQQRFDELVNKGPLGAAIRVKSNGKHSKMLNYRLFIGDLDLGVFTTDFSDHIVHGTEDNGVSDLLAHISSERNSGKKCGLEVRMEILSNDKKSIDIPGTVNEEVLCTEDNSLSPFVVSLSQRISTQTLPINPPPGL